MTYKKKKIEEPPKKDNGGWFMPLMFLLIGLFHLYHGLTGQGHYDRKYRYFYSAKEDIGISTVCLLGCVWMVCLLRRKPKPGKATATNDAVTQSRPPRGRLATSLAKPELQRHPVLDFFVPRFTPLALFLMSAAFLLLFFLNPDMNAFAYRHLIEDFDPRLYPFYTVVLLFIAGITFSLFHVFVKEEKSENEKAALLYFAVMVSGLSGLLAGARLLTTSHGFLALFPLWNIVNSLFLLLLYWMQQLDETVLIAGRPAPRQVLVGGLTVLAVFLVCQYAFHYHWTLTFSVCVCYATNVNSFLHRITARPGNRPAAQESE